MKGLHRQAFASIQLPSISGPINEGLEESGKRAERIWGGNGQVSEEAQKGNKEGAGSDPRGIQAERQQKWRGWLLVMPCKNGH